MAEGSPPPGANEGRDMKTIAISIGVVVIVVLLITSGTIGGALCVRGVGCMYSSGNGLSIDNRQVVTINTARP